MSFKGLRYTEPGARFFLLDAAVYVLVIVLANSKTFKDNQGEKL